ncbi:hypothetical protein ACX0MV_04685 [Pseudomonas borbori]
MPNFSDFFNGMRLAFRARYIWMSGVSLLVLVLAVLLAAQFSPRQPATVSLDVGISVVRLLLPLVVVFMTQELFSREFDRRYFLSTLTYPRSRKSMLFGRFLSIVALVIGLLFIMAFLLALVVMVVAQDYAQSTPVMLGLNYVVAISFIGVDILLLSAVACLLAVSASTPSFVLIGTLGFMMVARSFAAIVDLLRRDTSLVGDADSYGTGIGMLGYLLPDLGALDIRIVALYGKIEFLPSGWPWVILSSLFYIVALMAFAVRALGRKRFA